MEVNKDNYINLDAARGLAALLVLAGHLRNFIFVDFKQLGSPGIGAQGFYFVTGLGHLAVMVFFVLSGFLISQSIHGSVVTGNWSLHRYCINRLSRLWIVLIPALILTLFWDAMGMTLTGSDFYQGVLYEVYNSGPNLAGINDSISTFMQNIVFLQTITSPSYGTNSPMWSLANEFWYYILFPLGFFIFQKSSAIKVKTLNLLFLLMLFYWLPFDLLLYGLVWLMGYVCFLVVNKPSLFQRCGSNWFLAGSWLLFICCVVVARMQLIAQLLADFMAGSSFALLMLALIKRPVNHVIFVQISAFISQISYTLYLTHFPFIAFLSCWLLSNHQRDFTGETLTLYLGYLFLTMVYGYVVYWLFEKNTGQFRQFLFTSYRYVELYGKKIQLKYVRNIDNNI